LAAWLLTFGRKEYGHADVIVHQGADAHVNRLFSGIGESMHGKANSRGRFVAMSNFILAYMSHFDKLVKLPEGFVTVASTRNSEYAGIAHQTKSIYGVQFHPELEHVR
jgi:GMP synthase (glutamine-hydrolysing)